LYYRYTNENFDSELVEDEVRKIIKLYILGISRIQKETRDDLRTTAIAVLVLLLDMKTRFSNSYIVDAD
jgi:hypothetical protein